MLSPLRFSRRAVTLGVVPPGPYAAILHQQTFGAQELARRGWHRRRVGPRRLQIACGAGTDQFRRAEHQGRGQVRNSDDALFRVELFRIRAFDRQTELHGTGRRVEGDRTGAASTPGAVDGAKSGTRPRKIGAPSCPIAITETLAGRSAGPRVAAGHASDGLPDKRHTRLAVLAPRRADPAVDQPVPARLGDGGQRRLDRLGRPGLGRRRHPRRVSRPSAPSSPCARAPARPAA